MMKRDEISSVYKTAVDAAKQAHYKRVEAADQTPSETFLPALEGIWKDFLDAMEGSNTANDYQRAIDEAFTSMRVAFDKAFANWWVTQVEDS